MNRPALCLVALAAFPAVAVAAVPGLAPGPWRLATRATASGHNPQLHVFVRWTPQTEFGAQSGENAYPPIPKRLAFVIDQPRAQRAELHWSALCYKNREYGYPRVGSATATGRRVFYPKLYAQRVECDLYVNASVRGTGRMMLRVYGY